MKPRDYQLEAVEWALRKRQSIICMPTGTGKTLIAALWIKHLLKDGKVKKVLVLEPTRFLVEQTSRFLKRLGIPAEPVHGSMSRGARRRGWSSLVVVATPEIVESEGFNVMDEPGAIVVDECHHTTGQDSYVTVARRYRAEWRLGLTAYLPPSRRRMLEDYIGEARCWSWTDPRLAKYIPEWVGEVYEAPLNKAEERLYTRLEELWDRLHGVERVVIGNALRWLVRDGAIALRESYEKGGLLSRLLEPVRELLYSREVRPAHKLPTLVRILRDHEGYEKAIVFVDRVIVAELVSKSLRSLEPALILGRRRINPRISLEKAKRTRLIISTSAGEEGIDLPEADLLIIWSHTASPLRFIQRLGRILRPSRAKQKTAVFIATPDTVDMDSLVDGLLEAEKAGVKLGVSPDIVQWLWGLSRRRRILEALEEAPMTIDMIQQATGIPAKRVEASINWLLRHGYIIYIYTPYGKVYGPRYMPELFYERYREYLTPVDTLEATITPHIQGAKLRHVKGYYTRTRKHLQRLLDKYKMLTKITAHVRIRVNAVEKMIQLTYNYTIDNTTLLNMVLNNIYSSHKTMKLTSLI